MEKWSIRSILEPMSDVYFSCYKTRVQRSQQYLASDRNNQVINCLLDIVFSEGVLESVNKQQLSELISVLFDQQFKDSKWILKYIEEMFKYIPTVQGKLELEGRAKKYYDYLDKEVKELKSKGQKKESFVLNEELILVLMDYIRFIIALSRTNEAGDTADFSLEVDTMDTKLFIKQMFEKSKADQPTEKTSHTAPQGKTGFQISVPKVLKEIKIPSVDMSEIFKPKHNLNDREKTLSVLITWALVYRICEQDGIPVQGV